MVPTQLRRLLDADPGAAWARGFTSVLLGGAAAPAGLLDGARAAGCPVVTTYGMTETCGGCVYDGRPLDGVSVPDRRPTAARIRHQRPGAVLRLPGAAGPDRGRHGRSPGSSHPTWHLDETGRLTVRGRADDVIITGGEKVVADEVAALLALSRGRATSR